MNLFDALLTTQKAIVFIIQLTDFSAPNSRNCNWNTVVQVQQRTRMCLLSKVLSCCLPCRHVMCEVIIIRLPGSHGGAWHRVVWVTITINTLSYEQLENIWANCWFLITDLLGSVIHSYSLQRGGLLENWTKDLFACIAKWKIALEQPHAFCVWSGVNMLG